MVISAVIENKRLALAVLCTRHRVARLEVFGSAAGEGFDAARSDVDFLVEFDEMSPGDHAHAYFGLLRDLKTLLDRNVDLVEIKAVDNPYFLESIKKSRTLLYAA